MQSVKDSFYMALQDRLSQLNPETEDGSEVVVCENERRVWLGAADTFYLRWLGQAKLPPDADAAGWRSLQCEIGYCAAGHDDSDGDDRGRALAELDDELHAIVEPRQTTLTDYTVDPPESMGLTVLWTRPVIGEAQETAVGIRRTAQISVLWLAEVQA